MPTLFVLQMKLVEAVEDLKKNIDAPMKWFEDNQMHANPDKFQFCH